MLEGPCTATSLPGEHLFQASALPRNRMRPAIFHAFGKAKVGAQDALRDLERQGWETLPIAILGMPNLPPPWALDTWKPVGGCKLTGYSSGTVGNSALRRAILLGDSDLFPGQVQGDSLSCCPVGEDNSDLKSVSTPSSNNSANRVNQLTQAMERDSTKGSQTPHSSQAALSPLLLSPPLFVPWSQVANLRGIVGVHKDYEACPYDELKAAIDHVPGEKDFFLAANDDLLSQLEDLVMPLEGIATQVFQAIYQRQQAEISWIALLWTVAKINKHWIGYDAPPLPSVFQINCGGLGGGALEGDIPPHFHCTCPPVGDSQVCGPSLSPADVVKDQRFAGGLRLLLPPCSRSRKTLVRNGNP